MHRKQSTICNFCLIAPACQHKDKTSDYCESFYDGSEYIEDEEDSNFEIYEHTF